VKKLLLTLLLALTLVASVKPMLEMQLISFEVADNLIRDWSIEEEGNTQDSSEDEHFFTDRFEIKPLDMFFIYNGSHSNDLIKTNFEDVGSPPPRI
jgi:hypothetical protein